MTQFNYVKDKKNLQKDTRYKMEQTYKNVATPRMLTLGEIFKEQFKEINKKLLKENQK